MCVLDVNVDNDPNWWVHFTTAVNMTTDTEQWPQWLPSPSSHGVSQSVLWQSYYRMGWGLRRVIVLSWVFCSVSQWRLSGEYLKMTGKGFVLFKINSSPSAFYIIKPTCISWLVFKVSNYFKKNCRKVQTRTFVYVRQWWRHLHQNPNIQLVYTRGCR